ncbi:Peroxin 13, N-terminal region-domain-containing protein [Lipomyces japonicus]|uniref:Peroxin 13, N-terminal region-domain-containing protein n=1 Tax=Lipomyces japonicus TaxID=56871 RepID=UPI0034CE5F09
MSVPRPKPWEQKTATTTNTTVTPAVSSTASATTASNGNAPPPRPTAQISAPSSRPTYGAYSSPFSNPYSSPYSTYTPYSSPYSRLYGPGAGAGMGFNAAGIGMPGAGAGAGNGGGGSAVENSTAAAFQMLEAVVGAIGGFAQMLESTYMATHSSFFAMVGVAEQLTALRRSLLGSASIGMVAIWRVLVRIWRKIMGKSGGGGGRNDSDAGAVMVSEFDRFKRGKQQPVESGQRSKISIVPVLVFLAAVFGGPYLMSKLIKMMAATAEASGRYEQDMRVTNGGHALDELSPAELIIDPAKLEFCRALYDFTAENEAIELAFKKGAIIAIIARDSAAAAAAGTKDQDQQQEPTWWRGRLRDGRMGYFPSNYVELIKRKKSAE